MEHKDDCLRKLNQILAYLNSLRFFSEMLKLYMNRKNMASGKLAAALNVDPSTITHWLKDRRLPQDSSIIFMISKALLLNTRERRYLLAAWSAQKTLYDLVPYIDYAITNGDEIDEVVVEVEKFLEDQISRLEVQDG